MKNLKSVENELILPNQAGFKPSDFWTNQLLAITYKIYKSFEGVQSYIEDVWESLAWRSHF